MLTNKQTIGLTDNSGRYRSEIGELCFFLEKNNTLMDFVHCTFLKIVIKLLRWVSNLEYIPTSNEVNRIKECHIYDVLFWYLTYFEKGDKMSLIVWVISDSFSRYFTNQDCNKSFFFTSTRWTVFDSCSNKCLVKKLFKHNFKTDNYLVIIYLSLPFSLVFRYISLGPLLLIKKNIWVSKVYQNPQSRTII